MGMVCREELSLRSPDLPDFKAAYNMNLNFRPYTTGIHVTNIFSHFVAFFFLSSGNRDS